MVLDYLQTNTVLHKDIKPEIMVFDNNNLLKNLI